MVTKLNSSGAPKEGGGAWGWLLAAGLAVGAWLYYEFSYKPAQEEKAKAENKSKEFDIKQDGQQDA